MAEVYDFPEFGRNQFMPKGDRGSMKKLRSELRRLDQQRSLYDDYSQRTDIGPREIAYLDEILRRIQKEIVWIEQLITGGIALRQQGQGLSYKGKHHGFIRKICRMGKGLMHGGALDNANVAQYISQWYQRVRDTGPAEVIESDGDFWEAFNYIREHPTEKAGFPNRLLIRIFRMLDARGILFERVAGQLVPGPFFLNHEDMSDAARDFFVNNVAVAVDNNA